VFEEGGLQGGCNLSVSPLPQTPFTSKVQGLGPWRVRAEPGFLA
jgi:hypothetical protein